MFKAEHHQAPPATERVQSRRGASRVMRLVLAVALSAPVILVYLSHGREASRLGVSPRFFLQYDMPYYLANARQYVDGAATVAYANPYDFRADSPRIYFQPLTALFSLAYLLTPQRPDLLFVLIGLVCTVSAFFLLHRLVEDYGQPPNVATGIYLTTLTAWGGGLLVLAGMALSYRRTGVVDSLHLDPGAGWWFLTWGRNFLYPTEAFYHLIVLALLLAALRQRVGLVLACTGLLAISHPFTGLQYSIAVLGWMMIERVWAKSGLSPRLPLALFALPLAFVLGYYLMFLPRFSSHRILEQQWTLDWSMNMDTIIAAHALVALLAWRRWSLEGPSLFSKPFERLLLVCFLVSFGLATHDLFIEPRQPIHFTRGHTWLPLMLLGAPALVPWLNRVRARATMTGWIPVVLFTALVLTDETVFIKNVIREPHPFGLTSNARQLLNDAERRYPNHVLISDVEPVGYLSATLTSLRPYYGHWANTPWSELRRSEALDLVHNGRIPDALCTEPFVVITTNDAARSLASSGFARMSEREGLVLLARSSTATGCDWGMKR